MKSIQGLIEPLVLLGAANDHSEALSKRLREVWANKRRKKEPMTAWTPSWIEITEDRSGFRLIPWKAEIVRKIVGLALDGWGDSRLLAKLNADLEEWPVITHNPHWTTAFISKLLRTPALIGNYEPGMWVDGKRVLTGEVWEGYFPRVIDDDQWYRLRAARRARTMRGGPTGKDVANLFAGVLLNAKDGRPMQLHHKGKGQRRLISASHRDGLPGGDTQGFPYEPLERAFLIEMIGHLGGGDLMDDGPRKPADAAATLYAELADVEERIRQVKEKIHVAPNIAPLLDMLTELDSRREEIKGRLEEARSSSIGREHRDASIDDMRALAALLGDDEVEDREGLRTRLRARIREVISEMWILIVGKKRSYRKRAVVQVLGKGGQEAAFVLAAERDRLLRVSPIILMAMRQGDVITDEVIEDDEWIAARKLRLYEYHDEEKGEAIRRLEANLQREIDEAE